MEDVSDYPLTNYLNSGIKVTLNTDDMAISIDTAFTSESVKNELRKELGFEVKDVK